MLLFSLDDIMRRTVLCYQGMLIQVGEGDGVYFLGFSLRSKYMTCKSMTSRLATAIRSRLIMTFWYSTPVGLALSLAHSAFTGYNIKLQ